MSTEFEKPKTDSKKDFVKAFRLTIWIGLLVGVIVLLGGGYINDLQLREATKQIGLLILGASGASVFNEFILGDFLQRQNRQVVDDVVTPNLKKMQDQFCEMIKDIAPSVQETTTDAMVQLSQSIQDETNKTLTGMKENITQATNIMIYQIDVLSGAKASGIVNIFPRRYKTITRHETPRSEAPYPSVMDVIANDIAGEKSFIWLMGISLGDYFLDRGNLHVPLMEILETKQVPDIRALIVHPKSRALAERARWEANSRNNSDFFVSTTFIETDGSARIAKKLCQEHSNLKVGLYEQAPTAFVLLTTRYAFIEPYTYAARGSNVPTFQVQANSALYNNYLKHFKNVWDVSTQIDLYEPLKDVKGPFET
jgi:hypothetical protein